TCRQQWPHVQYDRPEEAAVQLRDLQARIKRLEELSRGFAQESDRLRKGEGEFLQMERVRYVTAIEDVRSCMERAGLVLAQVCTRLEERGLRVVTEQWDAEEPGG